MFSKQEFDSLGDRCKTEENLGSVQLDGSKSWIMRLDGRAFHTFTRGLERPFDANYRQCMVEAMCALVKEFRPNLAFQQSDEITLAFLVPPKTGKNRLFNMRVEKLCSIGGSLATLEFNRSAWELLPEKRNQNALFDARCYNTENLQQHILWRQLDCVRNSVAMAAQANFSHKQLHGVGHVEMLDMLDKAGKRWSNYEDWQRYGTFARKIGVERLLTEDELEKIGPEFRPTGPVLRSQIELTSCKFDPRMLTLSTNPIEVLLHD